MRDISAWTAAVAALTLAVSLFAGPALSESVQSPTNEKTSINEGTVCIWRGRTGSGADVMFRPDLGCLSSGCTTPLEQSLGVKVHQVPAPEISITSLFAVRLAPPGTICTADCCGAGAASTTLIHLPPGSYRITLGGRDIGMLDTERLKGDPFNRICFGTPKE